MKHISMSLLLAASLASLSAQADEIEKPWYVGAGVGMANFSVNKNSFPTLTPAASVDSSAYNMNAFIGYQFDPFLELELGYLGGGSIRATDAGQTSKLFNVDLTPITAVLGKQLSNNVRLYAKVGGVYWNFSSQQSTVMNDGFGPTVGLGANINLYGGTERQLRVEYNHYQLDSVFVKSANSLSISAAFFFSGK